MSKKKVLEVLTVIHYGNYGTEEYGVSAVIDDKCPCCNWDPSILPQTDDTQPANEPIWSLGMIWNPASERGIGAYFQVFHCQNCGLVYATHIN